MNNEKAHRRHILFAIVGFILFLVSMLSYLYYGYHTAITCLWILSIILVGVYFFKISPKKSQESFSGKDVITAIILTAIISIFYFSVGPEYPLQMVGDEVSITVKSIVLSQPGVDLFKPSDYYNLPAPFFAISGHFASLFGPIDVLNIRLIHTALGVIISILSFFLFRRIFPDFFRAILATLLISAQHSLFAISHLGILTNSAVLTYLISLLFLLTGLTKNSKGLSFIGGVVAGLGWYVYSPAKSIIVIWLLSLAIIAILCRINYLKKINLKTVIPATLIGFILAVCPFIIGAATTPQKGDTTWYYQQSQFLFHETSLRYSKKDSIFETVKSNAIDGLSTFNRNLQDRGYMYNHWEKNGFADPLTGIFLWIGVLSVLLTLRRQRTETAIIIIHFLLLLFTFMFIVNHAPNYTRLLIMLPLIIPLTIIGIQETITRVTSFFSKEKLRKTIQMLFLGIATAAIIFLNIAIFREYIQMGETEKEPIGDIVRHIHNQPEQKWYIFNQNEQQHYHEVWDKKDWQRLWLNLFIVFNEPTEDITLKYYTSYRIGRKWVLFDGHREPIRNTVYYIIEKIKKGPHYFYRLKEPNPKEFKREGDLEIWQNLFTVFRQSFETIPQEQFLAGEYRLPATFFMTDTLWETMRDKVSDEKKIITADYLSEKKNLLIIEIRSDEKSESE